MSWNFKTDIIKRNWSHIFSFSMKGKCINLCVLLLLDQKLLEGLDWNGNYCTSAESVTQPGLNSLTVKKPKKKQMSLASTYSCLWLEKQDNKYYKVLLLPPIKDTGVTHCCRSRHLFSWMSSTSYSDESKHMLTPCCYKCT